MDFSRQKGIPKCVDETHQRLSKFLLSIYILCKMYVCLHAELAERAWNAFELMKWRQQQGLSVVHCSHIFPPQQPNMWKKLTWARARRAARPTIAVIFFFQFSTPCSAVWENYAPADMINSWVDRSSWGSAYTHFIYCTYVDVHFFFLQNSEWIKLLS